MSTPLIGHKRQLDYLNRVIERDALAHAYLFYGPAHVGKTTVAQEIARRLDAEVTLLDRQHPLVAEKDEPKEIPIADIRELKRRFSFAAHGDRWRVAIIDEADTMSEEAANAFLKLLEEPGGRTLFFLIAGRREALPPTVVSRCCPVRFAAVPEDDMMAIKKEYGIAEPSWQKFLAIAAGRPGLAVRFCQDEEYAARELSLFNEAARAFRAKDPLMALGLVARHAGDETSGERLMEYCFRYLRKELIRSPADAGARRDVLERVARADRAAMMLATSNVQPRLALESMMLSALG